MSGQTIKFSVKKEFQKESQKKEELWLQLLKLIQKLEPVTPWEIQKGMSIDFNTLRRHLTRFAAAGILIEMDKERKNHVVKCYTITEKGIRFMMLVENILDLLPDVWKFKK